MPAVTKTSSDHKQSFFRKLYALHNSLLLVSFSWLPATFPGRLSLEVSTTFDLSEFFHSPKFLPRSFPSRTSRTGSHRKERDTRNDTVLQKRKMSVKRNSAAAFRLGVTRRGLILLLFSALVVFAMSSVRVAAQTGGTISTDATGSTSSTDMVLAQITAQEEKKLGKNILVVPVNVTAVSSIHLFHSKPFILNHILLSHISF